MNSLVGWKIYTVFLEIAIIWFGLGQWFQILGFGSLPLLSAFIGIHAICINTLGFFEVFAHRTLVAGFSQTSWALPTFSRGNCIGFSGGTAYLNLKMKESLALLRIGLIWKIIFFYVFIPIKIQRIVFNFHVGRHYVWGLVSLKLHVKLIENLVKRR